MMQTIRITGPVPGPKSTALLERRTRAVTSGVSTLHPIFIDRASSATVTDVDGNVFLDFTGGIGVLNAGHTHPDIVEAIARQAARLTHSCFQVAGYEEYIAVAETLCRLTPGSFEKRALLLSTGAEAIENAMKIARAATGRAGILCFDHSFHGRTLLALTMTGKAAPYKVGFGPYAPEVYRLPFPDPFRGEGLALCTPGGFEHALKTVVRPQDLAAVVFEPVLGEGGFIAAPPEFVREARAFCDRHGIVLVADEIQCGMARTGTMFASEQLGLEPDLMTVAKSMAGGLPLAAVVGRARIMDAVAPGGVGGTFGGNPIACAAALASMAVLERAVGAGRPAAIGMRARRRLDAWLREMPIVGCVRGLGAMLAVELVRDTRTRTAADAETKATVSRARDRGVLLIPAGTYGNVLRFLFPLSIADDELDEGLNVVEEALRAVS
jgi:4-aminobutyrate aminotransferase / (S)-3-amino-2-methylpropionate transaminase / 5-aminovalerate transaminase